jgi:hypothetical protein
MKLSKLTALLVLGFAACASGYAQTYDATADVTATTTANPNGVWTYGRISLNTNNKYKFTPLNNFVFNGSPEWIYNYHASIDDYLTGEGENVWKNLQAYPAYGVAPGQLSLHPGCRQVGGNCAAPNSEYPMDSAVVLRFTAPVAGYYDIDATFFPGASGETQAWIVKGSGFATPRQSFSATSVTPTYTKRLIFAENETLDFIVGVVNQWDFGNTPVDVKIKFVHP